MKKRIVLCLLALALLSAMTGCGKEKDADPLTDAVACLRR